MFLVHRKQIIVFCVSLKQIWVSVASMTLWGCLCLCLFSHRCNTIHCKSCCITVLSCAHCVHKAAGILWHLQWHVQICQLEMVADSQTVLVISAHAPPLSYQTSLPKQGFKDKTIKYYNMATAEPYIRDATLWSWLFVELHMANIHEAKTFLYLWSRFPGDQ